MLTDFYSSSGNGPLNAIEAQRLIENLKRIDIEDVGSPQWMKQRSVIETLNLQAHHNAMFNQDEFIVEAFISFGMIPTLIHELIVIEAWKLKIGPLLENEMVQNSSSMKPYFINYHEANIINLLECMLYHRDAVLGCEEMMIELVDYCQRKVNYLLITSSPTNVQQQEDQRQQLDDARQVFKDQLREMQLNICMCALTVLRYFTDHISLVPPSIMNRMLDTHDFAIALIYLVDRAPWKKRIGPKTYKFINGSWTEVKGDQILKLTQHEAQVWLAINNLIVDPECRLKYQYNSFRKDTLLKLKRHMNEILIDQIHVLTDLQRAVEEIQIMNPPEAANVSMLLIEQVPELYEMLMRKDFEEIAQAQSTTLFDEDENEKREEMIRMAKLFSEMVDLTTGTNNGSDGNGEYQQVPLTK